MTTTTDLKPGETMRHDVKGFGILCHGVLGTPYVCHAAFDGTLASDFSLTGWERVETCTHGERLILNDYAAVKNGDAVQVELFLDGVRIISEAEYARRTEMLRPGHIQVRVDDLNLSAWEGEIEGAWSSPATHLAIRAAKAAHRCKPTQPDEPQEFGARITVRFPNGLTRKLVRVVNDDDDDGFPWMVEDGTHRDWSELVSYGTVTLGWGEGQ